MSPELLKKILDAIASGDEKAQAALLPEIVAAMAGAGGAPAADVAPADADPLAAAADPPVENPEEMAALARLSKLTGKASMGEVVAYFEQLSSRVAKLDAESAALELSARRELVGTLVKLSAETPATAWEPLPAGADAKAQRTPVKRLMREPIAELRARVEALSKASPVKLSAEPPVTSTRESVSSEEITPRVIALAKKANITPEQLIERRKNAVRRI